MPKLLKSIYLIFIPLFLCSTFVFAEDITITTYYPSPNGVYNSLLADKLGVGDNDGDGSLNSSDVPTNTGDVWIKGNVGIGTSSPSTVLHISGNNPTIRLTDTSAPTTADVRYGAFGNYLRIFTDKSIINFLDTNNNSAADQYIIAANASCIGCGAYKTLFVVEEDGDVGIGNNINPSYSLDIETGDVNTRAGGYRDGGTCVAGTCASDIRLKKNIKSISSALEKVSKLKPVTFEFIDPVSGAGLQFGLIAQDVEKIFPEMVESGKDGIKNIHYGLELQMYGIQAIKELKVKNDLLEAKNKELEQRIKKLEAKLK